MSPNTKTKSVTFSLPTDLAEKLAKHCAFARITKSELVVRLLLNHFENPDPVLDSFGDPTKRRNRVNPKKRS